VLEVAHLKVDDIDSSRMLIRVEQGRGGRDHNAMLSTQLLALLRLWWRKGKRRGVMFPHGWLFPGRSNTDPISSPQLHRAVQEAAEVAGIDTTAKYTNVSTKTINAVTGQLNRLMALHQSGKLGFFGHLEHLNDRRAFLRHLPRIRKKRWVVYAKPPFGGFKAVPAYMSC
jgi:Phage integrase family